MKKYKVLTVCGTGIATSIVVSEKCKELLTERGLDIEVTECNITELRDIISGFSPDIIVHTVSLGEKVIDSIKTFDGLQFLTGMEMDELADEMAEYLKQMEKSK